MKKTKTDQVHSLLNLLIWLCLAVAGIASLLQYWFRDVLSEFPTDSF